jgi:hypothetical protein
MSDKVFLDTNIFVYTFDLSAPAKAATAASLTAPLCSRRMASSTTSPKTLSVEPTELRQLPHSAKLPPSAAILVVLTDLKL